MDPKELLHEGERTALTVVSVSERALAYFLLARAWVSLGLQEPARRALHQSVALYQKVSGVALPQQSLPRRTLREIVYPLWQSQGSEDNWGRDIVTLLVEVRDVEGALSLYELYHNDYLLNKMERLQPGSTKRFPRELPEQGEDDEANLRFSRSRKKPLHSEAFYARLLKRASTIHQRLYWVCECSEMGFGSLARKEAEKITDPILRAICLHRVALNEWGWGRDRTFADWERHETLEGLLPRATLPPPATAALFRRTFPVVTSCPRTYNWALSAFGVRRIDYLDDETMALLEAVGAKAEMHRLLQKQTFEVGENQPFRYPSDLYYQINGPIYQHVLWYRRLKDKAGLVQLVRKLEASFLKVLPEGPNDRFGAFDDYRMWHYWHLYLVEQARSGDRAGAEAFLETLVQHYERTPFVRKMTSFNPSRRYEIQENGLLFSLLAVSFSQLGALERGHAVLLKALQSTETLEGVSPELLRAAGLANLVYGYARCEKR